MVYEFKSASSDIQKGTEIPNYWSKSFVRGFSQKLYIDFYCLLHLFQ